MNKRIITHVIITVLFLVLSALCVFGCGIAQKAVETADVSLVHNQASDPTFIVSEPSFSPTPVQSSSSARSSPPASSPSPSFAQIDLPVYSPSPIPISNSGGSNQYMTITSPEPEPVRVLLEAWPVHMYIPAMDVDAVIQDTGTDYAVDSMEIAPSGSIISWWRESAIPGNKGNAIFGGHNRWDGENGQLYTLDTLDIGDEMEIVYADGTSLIFMLESVFVYPLATAPADVIMDVHGEPRVTVITCKEPFNPAIGTSDNRIIAIFKLESDFVIPDPPIEPFPLRQ